MSDPDCHSKPAVSCDKCGHRLTNAICSTSPDVWKILDLVKQKNTFKPHQVIFYQESKPLGLYIISSGLARSHL